MGKDCQTSRQLPTAWSDREVACQSRQQIRAIFPTTDAPRHWAEQAKIQFGEYIKVSLLDSCLMYRIQQSTG
jgi:hypothetical protein